MVSAKDVVNFFIMCSARPERMTNMRANKLAYYSQAWSIVRLGHPLFQDSIEAWEHGPVIQSIYRAYSVYRNNPIPAPESVSFLDHFSEEERQLLIDVSREYDTMSTWQLRNLTHSESEPWCKVYKPHEKHTIIPTNLIESCFKELIPLPRISLEDSFSAIPVVDALPLEWEDDGWEEDVSQ